MRFPMFFWRVTTVLLFTGTLFGQTFIKITVDHANTRESPNSQAKILAVLQRDQTYPVIEYVPYWYGLRLTDGRTAYVA